jgi:hypothetical protein
MNLRYLLIGLGSMFISAMFVIGLDATVRHVFGHSHLSLLSLLGLPVFLIVGNGLDKPFRDIE